MSIIGGILRYTLVLLIILLGVCVILAGAMVLIPSFYLFGIHYIGQGNIVDKVVSNDPPTMESVRDQSYNAFLESSAFIINSAGYDVTLRTIKPNELPLGDTDSSPANTFRFSVANYLTGFAWGDIKMPYFEYGQTTFNNELVYQIDIYEPSGWLFHSNTLIEIAIDENVLKTKNVIINGTGGKVIIGSEYIEQEGVVKSKLLKLNNLKIEKQKGNVNFKYTEFVESSLGQPTITIKKTEGEVSFERDLKSELNVSIDGGFGKVLMKDVMSASGGDGQFVRINATNSEIRFAKIRGDLDVECKGGFIKGDEVTGSVNVKCTSCDVQITSVDDYFTFESTEGNAEIGKVGKYSEIYTKTGVVSLGETLGTVKVETEKGNISLGKVNKSVDSKSLYGVINITWNNELSYNSAHAEDFETVVKSKYGTVNVSNVIGKVVMQAIEQGTAAFNATFLQVNGKSSIETNAGAVSLRLPINMPYFLSWTSAVNSDIKEYGSYITTDKTGQIEFLGGTDSGPSIAVKTINGVFKVRGIL